MTILEYCAVQVPSTSPGARLVCAGEAEAYDKKRRACRDAMSACSSVRDTLCDTKRSTGRPGGAITEPALLFRNVPSGTFPVLERPGSYSCQIPGSLVCR